ncbi:MAG TPA: hypothetical protein VFV79_01860, partial [Saprospiraceae bacterium]|nr:hypothetical protein [Saprospiraceae bacterium]
MKIINWPPGFSLILLFWVITLSNAQVTSNPTTPNFSANLKVEAVGTGETTGHIADLIIKSKEKTEVQIQAQSFYIPSDGRYQSYVAEIPKSSIQPGGTTTIPVTGYCADIHTPPVPKGISMPPVDSWIPVGINSNPGEGIPILPHPAVPSFDPVNIDHITTSPGFTVIPTQRPTPATSTNPNPKPTVPGQPPLPTPGANEKPVNVPAQGVDPDRPQAGVIPTWPGTDKPVGGTIRPDENPKVFGPVLVGAIDQIANAFDKLRDEGKVLTPFSGDPEKEREAVIQQTFWIYTAAITGKPYQRENFQERVFKQFKDNTGTSVAVLPEQDKKKLDSGISQFWNVFSATGVEAKVISDPSKTTTSEPNVPSSEVPPALIKTGGCTLEEKVTDSKTKLDYAIAETGTKSKNEKVKEAFQKAIEEAAGLVSDKKGSDTVDIGFSTPQMPASAWSLWFPHVVAGQANATAFAVDLKNPLESAWTTDPLQTSSDGNRVVVLTHLTDPKCKSTLIGINFAKVRASSGLKASLG